VHAFHVHVAAYLVHDGRTEGTCSQMELLVIMFSYLLFIS